MKKCYRSQALWWTVIALTMLLIWGQSLLGRDASTTQSETLKGLLGRLFGEGIYTTFFYQNIRKVAHFAEYAVLGAEWGGFRLSGGARRPARWLMLAAGPLTATCDELVQFISARAPRVTDVLLDCGGYFCGMGVVFGLAILWRWLRRKYSAAK